MPIYTLSVALQSSVVACSAGTPYPGAWCTGVAACLVGAPASGESWRELSVEQYTDWLLARGLLSPPSGIQSHSMHGQF